MKRVLLLVISILLVFSLCGCGGAGSYHKATEGDLTVSLPEKQEEVTTVDPAIVPLIGRWNLVSIVSGEETLTYEGSYYEFRESGRIKIKLNRDTADGRYTVEEDKITIKSDNSSYEVTFTLNEDKLTITTSSGDVHNLIKITETES